MTSLPVRVLTHNIRYATSHPFEGEKLWSLRKQYILNEIRFNTIHNDEAIVCCQEVLHSQLNDILIGLNSGEDRWAYVGVGRDDGKEAGEYSPIFYRPKAWQLLDSETIWLSPTPDIPSKGWDAASIRIVVIGRFKHTPTGRQIVVMNTHLDDQGSKSRLESAKIIASLADSMSHLLAEPGLPVLLAGDFNSEPNEEAYLYITKEAPFRDTFNMVLSEDHYGHTDTFTGFKNLECKRIDFLFVKYANDHSLDTPWVAQNHAVLSNRFDNGIFSSDHRAVVADLLIR